jgi:excinuclease ABC subunit A
VDHLIDLGPEGGPDGGRLIASGTPEEVARRRASHTGRHLDKMLGSTKRRARGNGAALHAAL